MKIINEKINVFIIILFIIGIFFASARTITHINHVIKNNNQLAFFNHYTNVKNSYSIQKKNIQSEDLCEKIDNHIIDRHYLRWVFETDIGDADYRTMGKNEDLVLCGALWAK